MPTDKIGMKAVIVDGMGEVLVVVIGTKGIQMGDQTTTTITMETVDGTEEIMEGGTAEGETMDGMEETMVDGIMGVPTVDLMANLMEVPIMEVEIVDGMGVVVEITMNDQIQETTGIKVETVDTTMEVITKITTAQDTGQNGE